MGNRFLKNFRTPSKKFTKNNHLINNPVIAFSESELWNPNDNKENWILTAGKIQNLRIAAKKLNGIEVNANEVFSFWRHIGNPNVGKGFVVGREIREGCIVPTIAGGLCQLSNALFDAALNANFEIIERHKHTKIIAGSLAEKDRDATVKWNYIDFRFRVDYDFRIEAELTANKLIVQFKGKQTNKNPLTTPGKLQKSDQLNDCFSCGNTACYKHPNRSAVKQNIATTTFILDDKWPEFDDYLSAIKTESDCFILPLRKNRLVQTDRYFWKSSTSKNTKITTLQGLCRAVILRFATKRNNVFDLSLRLDKIIALAAAKRVPIDATHLIISQNLLPFIYETGILGGRTFDVLMTRLPIQKIHERLDYAYSKHPNSTTLKDFRAPNDLIISENNALTKARKLITPHSEIAELFKYKTAKLNWKMPKLHIEETNGTKILFPASAVGRKGAYEIKKLAEELNFSLVILGRTTENDSFWENIKIEQFNGNLNDIGLIIYPTYIEHQPRHILKAISKRIPVITTTACGISSSDHVKIVEIGNYEQLKDEVSKQVQKMQLKTNVHN